jgi:uncharacterized protein YndB with AHSA1/START domain
MSATETNVVELEIRLGAPPGEVFLYLTDAERYVRWQGVKAELDPRPGGVFRVWMDADTVARGEFVEVESPSRIVFTWGWEGNEGVPPGSTTVEFTLQADGDGTVLSLRHTGLPDGEHAAMHEEGWRFFTDRLAKAVRGEEAGAMPSAPPPAPPDRP